MSPRIPTLLPLLLLCAACADGPDSDDDGDGLDASFEAEVGTSDTSADSDGDGCSDAVEVLGYFDPLDPADRPYAGGYPRGPRPADDVFDGLAAKHGEGFEEGKLDPDWTLTDQYGEEIELRDFYGQVVVVDLSSEWCGPCNDAAPILDQFYQENADKGFVVLQLLLEGVENNSEPEADRWIEGTGATYPVLVDWSPGDFTLTDVAQYYLDVPDDSYEIPNYTLLDREQRITDLYVLGELSDDLAGDLARYRSALEEPIPEVEVVLPDNADALRAELGMDPDSWITPASLCGGGE